VNFFGIPVVLQSYTATVIPVILAVFLQSKIEKLVIKYIHDSVRNFVVPVIALVISLPATLLVLGPLGNWLGRAIADVFIQIQGVSPILTGALFAALWQVLVVSGPPRTNRNRVVQLIGVTLLDSSAVSARTCSAAGDLSLWVIRLVRGDLEAGDVVLRGFVVAQVSQF